MLLVVVRHPGRAGRARPLRHAAGRRHHDVVRRAGGHQPRRRDRPDAGHRPDAAVLLGRRLVAVRVDDGGRPAAQRRPPRPRERWPTFAVVTGGGTAGHVLPALAIAEALVDHGHEPARSTTSARRAASRPRLLPATPFPHTFLDVTGLQRELNVAQRPAQRGDGAQARRGAAAPRCACCASCARRSSCRSAATPACPPCSRPGGCTSRSSSSATTAGPGGPAR